MKKAYLSALIIALAFSFRLYSQIYPVEVPYFEDFLGSFINANLDYLVVSNEIIRDLLTSRELENLYKDGMKDFSEAELVNIMNNPNRIFDYTTNESLILMGGTVFAVFETVKAQSDLNAALLDKF